jgi:hypothetical protein
MLASSGVDEKTEGHRAPVPPTVRRRLYLYLLPLIGSPFLLLMSALIILPSKWFALH